MLAHDGNKTAEQSKRERDRESFIISLSPSLSLSLELALLPARGSAKGGQESSLTSANKFFPPLFLFDMATKTRGKKQTKKKSAREFCVLSRVSTTTRCALSFLTFFFFSTEQRRRSAEPLFLSFSSQPCSLRQTRREGRELPTRTTR